MKTNQSPDNRRQVSRREALRTGACGAAAALAAGGLNSRVYAAPAEQTPEQKAADEKAARDEAAKTKAKAKKVQAKSVIQIFLWGGMSHNDAWDPKPGTGYDFLGEFDKFIPTNVPGIQLGALFPQLAKQADKYSLIRSMTHGNNGHETAAYLMQTGHKPGGRLAYPSVGAIFTFFKKEQYKGLLPPYVVMLQAAGRFSEEGFLGPAYKPFATGGDPNAARFEVEGIVNRGIDDGRQRARRELVDKINLMGYGLAEAPEMAAVEEAKQKAYGLILGSGKEVFNLDNEPKELRDRYGRNTFGQECLAARRLGHAFEPLRDDEATVSDVGPRPGSAACGLERKGPAGQHAGLVHGRVRPNAQGVLGAAVERGTPSFRLGVHRAGRRRRIQGRLRRRLVRRERREGQGTAGLPVGPAGYDVPAGRHRRQCQVAASLGLGRLRFGHRERRHAVSRASGRDIVAIDSAWRSVRQGDCRTAAPETDRRPGGTQ